jgi:Kinetochore protein CHL4 like
VRVGDSSSTEPMELLQAARASETGEATGRFSYIATHDVESDPLTEMQEVSAASIMDRTSEDARLQISSEHGRQAGQEYLEAIENCENSGGALAASSDAGVIIDHEASLREKRLRLRGSIFGEGGPRLKKLRFKWTGETLATSDVWGAQSNRSAKCKCTFSFRGSHALEGLREMVDLGVFQAPLPSFILDAPLAGTSTIVIRDGAIVKEK